MEAVFGLVDFDRLVNSKLFTFIVGEEKKAITVHSAVVGSLSKTLDTLMNGSMSEAQSKIATLNDVEPGDFARFLQFAYTGDYTPPAAVVVNKKEKVIETGCNTSQVEQGEKEVLTVVPEELLGSAEPAEAGPFDEYWGVSKKKNKKKSNFSWAEDVDSTPTSRKAALRMTFNQKAYCLDTPRNLYLSKCVPATNSNADQDFGPVFIAHARLYIFADKYGIPILASLSLHKLHQTLMNFTLFTKRTVDVIALVQEVYLNTADRDEGDHLRDLVTSYVACEIDTIGKSTEYLTLMAEGGDFVKDFWKMVQASLL